MSRGMLALAVVIVCAWCAPGIAMTRAAWEECRASQSRRACWYMVR